MIGCTSVSSDSNEEEEEQQVEEENIEQLPANDEGGCSEDLLSEADDSEAKMNTVVEYPCGQPLTDLVASSGSTDIENAVDVGSVELVGGTSKLGRKETVSGGNGAEKEGTRPV